MHHETPLGREVVIIVLAGAALGLLHNGVGLATRPPRGIPWVATPIALPKLGSLTQADSGTAAPAGQVHTPDKARMTSLEVPPSGLTPALDDGAGRARGRAGGPAPGSVPAGTAPNLTASPNPGPTDLATARPAPSGARPAAPLPFIPESGQPIQVELATVKRFFDARAALFLDARDPAEYEAGHIPGALRLTNPEAQGEPDRLKALPVQGRPIIAYCEGGTCEASLELARTLIEAGYRKVLVYMGGYPEWAAASHPVERGSGGR